MIIHLENVDSTYMGPDKDKIRFYANAVDQAITDGWVTGPLTGTCPECNSNFDDLDEAYEDVEHIIVATTADTTAVIVGCEGYFMIDPNSVGIPSPEWTSVRNQIDGL